jgi:general secretion pathway protein D
VIPSAFESKNVGVTLEVMPTVGPDGVTINLTASPRIVDFLGFIDYSGVKSGDAPPKPESYPAMLKAPLKGGGVWQPVFSSREVSTTVALYSGQTLLIAETGEGPRCFIFLTATVIPEQ